MKILSVNAGSSSLKFTLFEMPEEQVIANGVFEKIGLPVGLYTIKYNGNKIKKECVLENHVKAVDILLKELIDNSIINSYEDIEGIGHRIAHGSNLFDKSVIVDDESYNKIKSLIPLAPLHNKPELVGIDSFKKVLSNVKEVAVFDTAFHQTMKESEYLYPVPLKWYKEYSIRKYGFHGTSHRYVSEYMHKYFKKDLKIINCHIGNGASICAIKDGKCVDTSMGFTPLSGIMMGTRSGDVDPSVAPYICEQTNISIKEYVDKLNNESGLYAISGISSDLRDVESEYLKGNERCALALEMYSRKIVNYISMYYTLLEKPDIISFTAGGGEHSSLVRKLVCDKLSSLNIFLDYDKNENNNGAFEEISSDKSEVHVFVIPTDEEVMIARDTYNLVQNE